MLESPPNATEPPRLGRRVLSGIRWSTALRILALGSGLAVNVLLARILSPADLGAYFIVITLVGVVSLASALGLNQAVVRGISETVTRGRPAGAASIVHRSLRVTAAASIVLALLFLLVGHVFARHVFSSTTIAGATVWIAIFIPITALRLVVPEAFRGFNDIKWASILGDAATNITLALGLAAIVVAGRKASLEAVLLLSIGLSAALLLVSLDLLRRKVRPLGVDRTASAGLLRIALPLLATNLTWNVMVQIDTLVLGAFRPARDVAYYGAGSRLAALLVVPLLIGNSVLAPLITELWAAHRMPDLERLLRTASTVTGVASGAGLVVLAAIGPWTLGFLFGDFYRRGGTVLLALAIGSFLNSVSGACGLALMMTGEQVSAMVITLVVAVLTIGGSAIAASSIGALGVAIAMACGVTLENVLNVAVVRARLGIWTYPDFSLRAFRQLLGYASRLASR